MGCKKNTCEWSEIHFDIGSRVDELILALFSLVDVTLIDIRPLDISNIVGLEFLQADAISLENV